VIVSDGPTLLARGLNTAASSGFNSCPYEWLWESESQWQIARLPKAVSYLSAQSEMQALLEAMDNSWGGRRDHPREFPPCGDRGNRPTPRRQVGVVESSASWIGITLHGVLRLSEKASFIFLMSRISNFFLEFT
jgi:hypothetical protein